MVDFHESSTTMNHIPDLVRDSKLNTSFHTKYTRHRYHDTGSTPAERSVIREEFWKREQYVGGGAYGKVWLERCLKGSRDSEVRAVKEVPRTQLPHTRVDYNRELEAIAKFSHQKYVRCFVKSFGWYENEVALFIAMEYCPQGDLQRFMSTSPPLEESAASLITYQLIEGLAFLHENGFAHRDLKPSNILIKAAPPEQWWVKIGDFGISKRAEDGAAASSTLKGTMGYMSPELHGFIASIDCFPTATHAASCAADMWSLGEVVFQIMTKEPSFRNMGVLAAFVNEPQLFPSTKLRQRNISDPGIDFVTQLMRAQPRQRLDIEQALHHIWTAPWKASSPRPMSIASTASSELNHEAFDFDFPRDAEPSNVWSTVSVNRSSLGTAHNLELSGAVQQGSGTRLVGPDMATDSLSKTVPRAFTARLDQSAVESHPEVAFEASSSLSPDLIPHLQQQSARFENLLSQVAPEYYYNEAPQTPQALVERSMNSAEIHRKQGSSPTDVGAEAQIAFISDAQRLAATDIQPLTHAIEHLSAPQENPYRAFYKKDLTGIFRDDDKFYVSHDGSGTVLNNAGEAVGDLHECDPRALKGLPVSKRGEVLSWNGLVVGAATFRTKSLRQPATRYSKQESFVRANPQPQQHNPDYNTDSVRVPVVKPFKGNLVVDMPQPSQFLRFVRHVAPPGRDEFTHSRYTAITCKPRDFSAQHYTLRPHLFERPRVINVLITVSLQFYQAPPTWPNLLYEICNAANHLSLRPDFIKTTSHDAGWKSIMIAIAVSSCPPPVMQAFDDIGLNTNWHSGEKEREPLLLQIRNNQNEPDEYYDDGKDLPMKVKGKQVGSRLYEYSSQTWASLEPGRTNHPTVTPLQIMLCRIGDLTPKKDWLQTFSDFLQPELRVNYDINETCPQIAQTSMYKIWKAEKPALSNQYVTVVDGNPGLLKKVFKYSGWPK